MDAFHELVNKYNYGINIINSKITQPNDDVFFDERLNWLPYLLYMYYGKEQLGNYFNLSIERSWRIEKNQRTSTWDFFYSLRNSNFHLDEAIQTLKEWPLELIRWPIYNGGIVLFFSK